VQGDRGPTFTYAVAYTNEFQKRGLPHSHFLVWQCDIDREASVADVDRYISAELPDPSADPLGFFLVEEFMIQDPCGSANPNSPCTIDDYCLKGLSHLDLKQFFYEAGYPLYRRRKLVFVPGKGMCK
jgi:hypothetical protein